MKVLLLTIMMGATLFLQAQSLENFVREAQYHQKLQAREFQIESTFAQEKAALAWKDPQFSIGVGVLPIETRVGPQVFKMGVQQQIPFGSIQKAKRAEVSAVRQSLEEEKALMYRQLRYEIGMAYLDASLTERKIQVYKSFLEVNEQIRADRVRNMQQKMGHYSDVLVVDRMIQQTQRSIDQASNELQQHQLRLTYWSGVEIDSMSELTTQFEIELKFDTLLKSIDRSPALLQIEAQKGLWEARQRLLTASAWPGISVGLDYLINAVRTDADLPDNGQDALIPKVGFTLPLSQSYYKGKRESQQMEIAALEQMKTDQANWLRQQIQQALIAQKDAVEEYQFYNQQIRNTQEIIELIEIEISSDHTRFLEYWDYQKQLLEYQIKQIESIKKWHAAAFIIERIENSSDE